jgi:hypothetical protein
VVEQATGQIAEDGDLEATVRAYLGALNERNLTRCIEFFAEDATVTFMARAFRGRQAIEAWHRERFAAELEVVRIGAIRHKGDSLIVDGVVTSKRIRALKIGSLGGRATVSLENSRVKAMRFGLRPYNPFEGW